MPKGYMGEDVFLGFADNIRTTVVIFITESYRNRRAIFVAIAFFGAIYFTGKRNFYVFPKTERIWYYEKSNL